jgi:hypothetical protein
MVGLRMMLESTTRETAISADTMNDLTRAGLKVRDLGDGYVRVGEFPARVRVLASAEMTGGGLLLCQLWDDGPQQFLDNVKSICCRCFREVRHRPHVPAGMQKICVECLPKKLAN